MCNTLQRPWPAFIMRTWGCSEGGAGAEKVNCLPVFHLVMWSEGWSLAAWCLSLSLSLSISLRHIKVGDYDLFQVCFCFLTGFRAYAEPRHIHPLHSEADYCQTAAGSPQLDDLIEQDVLTKHRKRLWMHSQRYSIYSMSIIQNIHLALHTHKLVSSKLLAPALHRRHSNDMFCP